MRGTFALAFIFLSFHTQIVAGDPPTLLFLCAGQSNMVGYGELRQLPKGFKFPGNVEIWSAGRWTELRGQGETFGPELAFAQMIGNEFPKERIGIVKVAKGGTGIDQWSPGDPKSLYAQLITQYRQALFTAPDSKPAGMLWVQGERDAREKVLAETYTRKLDNLIAAIRRDVDDETMPFLCAQINPPYPFTSVVADAQKTVNKRVAKTAAISTSGLKKIQDNLHYNTSAQLELGRRFGKVFLKLADERKQSAETSPDKTPSLRNCFPPGATYEGTWTNHDPGANHPKDTSRATVKVITRDGDFAETEWKLHKWNAMWRFKGKLSSDSQGNSVFVSTDITKLNGDHPNEGNTIVVVRFSTDGSKFKGIAHYRLSGGCSRFETDE